MTETTRVRYCCSTNSTLFCTQCDVAVLDSQTHCPGCKREVVPSGVRSRHDEALRAQLGTRGYEEHWARVSKLVENDRKGIVTP